MAFSSILFFANGMSIPFCDFSITIQWSTGIRTLLLTGMYLLFHCLPKSVDGVKETQKLSISQICHFKETSFQNLNVFFLYLHVTTYFNKTLFFFLFFLVTTVQDEKGRESSKDNGCEITGERKVAEATRLKEENE